MAHLESYRKNGAVRMVPLERIEPTGAPEQPKYVIPADWPFEKLRKLAATRLRVPKEAVQGFTWREATMRWVAQVGCARIW